MKQEATRTFSRARGGGRIDRTLLGAPGISMSNKKLLGTRSNLRFPRHPKNCPNTVQWIPINPTPNMKVVLRCSTGRFFRSPIPLATSFHVFQVCMLFAPFQPLHSFLRFHSCRFQRFVCAFSLRLGFEVQLQTGDPLLATRREPLDQKPFKTKC